MTEAEAIACLRERSEVRRCVQNATLIEILQAYFGVECDLFTRRYIFPDGTWKSELSVAKNERVWIEKAVDLEAPYGPFEA